MNRPAILGAILAMAALAHAQPRKAPTLTDLVAGAGDDARKAIAIGPSGEVYEPDGKGGWIRDRPIATADKISVVGRSGSVFALAEGVVYRLAENGWTALRLVQKGKAVMSAGRAIAVVGQQLFALDKSMGGEPAKLAMAPQPVLAIGAGAKAIVIATERGLLRAEGAGAPWKPIARAPRRVDRLVDDRWALIDRGPVDLKSGAVAAWPADVRVGVVVSGPKSGLYAIGSTRAGIELITIEPAKAAGVVRDEGAKFTREPIAPEGVDLGASVPVGMVSDKTGRIVVAFRDGKLAIRDHGIWTSAAIVEALPAPRPGAPPATSP